MNYNYCSSCNKRIELKYKKSHFKSESHMKTEGTVFDKYIIRNPELCKINNILIKNVNNYNERFEDYKIACKWKLVFDNDISVDFKSQVVYRISVSCHNVEEYLINKINYYRRQGLEF